jgi:CheY-like chemotaxis protein
MGGYLRAESELGRGSAFILSLPLQEGEGDVTPVPIAEPCQDCGHTARLKILVAEDNPINQELTTAMVDKGGHESSLARDGQEAVEAVLQAEREGKPYDIVLMDMQMPNMDGLQATRAIRAAGIGKEALAIIAVTANAYSDDVQKCVGAGMQAHLAKPLRMKSLCSAIGTWSSRLVTEDQPSDEPFEEETNPRLRAMFEDRNKTALDAIEAAIQQGSVNEDEKGEIAGLLHQIAGVAAYFGQGKLGEFCRMSQRELNEPMDETRAIALLQTIRERIMSTLAKG